MKPFIYLFFFAVFSTVSQAEVIVLTPAQVNNMAIEVATISDGGSMSAQRYSAEVVLPPSQMRIVTAPQQGLLDQLTVSTGQVVKRGQRLAHMASTGLVALQSDYLQVLTQKQLAQKALARDKALFADGIIAQRRYLKTQSAYQALAALLAEKSQVLAMSGMSKAAIQQLADSQQLSNALDIVAPMSGYVVEQMVSVGQRLEMSAPIYKIAQLEPLWLEVNVPVDLASQLKPGMLVEVLDQAVSGKVISVLRLLDKQTQTRRVRAEVTKGAGLLVFDQFVEVAIKAPTLANQLTVPRSALVHHAQRAFVFKQVDQGFEPIPVQIVGEQNGSVVIEGNLASGEMVAIKGMAALKGSWLGVGGE